MLKHIEKGKFIQLQSTIDYKKSTLAILDDDHDAAIKKLNLDDWFDKVRESTNWKNLFSEKYSNTSDYGMQGVHLSNSLTMCRKEICLIYINAYKNDIALHEEIMLNLKASILDECYKAIAYYTAKNLRERDSEDLINTPDFCENCNNAANHAVSTLLLEAIEIVTKEAKTNASKPNTIIRSDVSSSHQSSSKQSSRPPDMLLKTSLKSSSNNSSDMYIPTPSQSNSTNSNKRKNSSSPTSNRQSSSQANRVRHLQSQTGRSGH
jgi:hypothetical protein